MINMGQNKCRIPWETFLTRSYGQLLLNGALKSTGGSYLDSQLMEALHKTYEVGLKDTQMAVVENAVVIEWDMQRNQKWLACVVLAGGKDEIMCWMFFWYDHCFSNSVFKGFRRNQTKCLNSNMMVPPTGVCAS